MKHNKTIKKFAQILILAALISTIFTACDEADADADTTDVDTETAVLEETEDTRIYPDLPEYDWDGYNFKILTIGSYSTSAWSIRIPRDIAVEEVTAEPFNDSIYYRNRSLEEKYNFTIEHILMPENASYPLRTAVMAGDEYFDAISELIAGGAAGASAKEGLLVDLYKLEYLDLTKPWWDQGFVENLTLKGKLFFINGDSTLINRDSTGVMLFNKNLREAFQLENPYELVCSNQWTFSKLYEMAAAAATDLNGDGKMDSSNDRYGLVISSEILSGAGIRSAETGADGLPYLTFASERNFNAVYACWNVMDADFTYRVGSGITDADADFEEKAGGGLVGKDFMISEPEAIFKSGRSLFFSTMIRTVESLRGDEVDFGILPMPKYDENQKEWGHKVDVTFGQVIAVPDFKNDEALQRTGFILEAIASESTYTTVPAWYEVQLTNKFVRDAESKEMLDIIFSSVTWDPYVFYYWGSFSELGAASSGKLASGWASSLKKTETEMNATIKAFEKLD